MENLEDVYLHTIIAICFWFYEDWFPESRSLNNDSRLKNFEFGYLEISFLDNIYI